MCYIIYKTTNLINEKIYVGQHYTSANDGYLGSGKILKRSIRKNGIDNFKREILDYCASATVNEKEIYWIDKLSATDINIGYNLTNGGEGTRGIKRFGKDNSNYKNKWTNEQKKKLSNVRKKNGRSKGKNNPNYGNGYKIAGKNNYFYGKHHREEVKHLISKKTKEYWKHNKSHMVGRVGVKHPSHKYVYKMISPDGIIYENIYSINVFCKEHGLNTGSVYSRLKIKKNTYKKWKIYRELHEKF